MVELFKYKFQLGCLAILLPLLVAVVIIYPTTEPLILADLLFDGGMALCCLYLMFNIEELKESREIYRILLAASTMMFVANFWDFADELTNVLDSKDIIEDILKAAGFLLFLFGCSQWVKFHKKQCELMSRLAETDPLTGVLNRRALTMRADSLLSSPVPENTIVSVIIFDIDHFKQVNDSFGHQVGDIVLVEIATAVKSVIRKNDYLARLGGEEFVLFLYDTDLHGVKQVAEKIRNCIEQLTISHDGNEITCSVSLGLATSCNPLPGVLEELIGQADNALYEAKSNGRNCWRVADECHKPQEVQI